MAQRFYFSRIGLTPAIVIPIGSGWQYLSEYSPSQLYSTKYIEPGGLLIGTQIGPWPAGQMALDRQLVSAPLAAGVVFDTSTTVKGYVMAREYSTNDNVTSLISNVRIVSLDGTVVRATLLATGANGMVAELINNVTHRNKCIFLTKALTGTYTTVLGDRVVVELGYRDTSGSTPEATAKYGMIANTLPENETQTTDGTGWVEFSNTITFDVPTPIPTTIASLESVSIPAISTVGGIQTLFVTAIASVETVPSPALAFGSSVPEPVAYFNSYFYTQAVALNDAVADKSGVAYRDDEDIVYAIRNNNSVGGSTGAIRRFNPDCTLYNVGFDLSSPFDDPEGIVYLGATTPNFAVVNEGDNSPADVRLITFDLTKDAVAVTNVTSYLLSSITTDFANGLGAEGVAYNKNTGLFYIATQSCFNGGLWEVNTTGPTATLKYTWLDTIVKAGMAYATSASVTWVVSDIFHGSYIGRDDSLFILIQDAATAIRYTRLVEIATETGAIISWCIAPTNKTEGVCFNAENNDIYYCGDPSSGYNIYKYTRGSYMASLTKTVQTELKAISAVAANAKDESTTLTVTGALAVTVFVDYAPDGTGTPTYGTDFFVQGSEKASGNDTWRTLAAFRTGNVAATQFAVDGTEAAGSTVIEESATTGLAVGDTVFFKNGTLLNSEWAEVVALTANVSFTIRDGLTNAQTSSAYFNKCEHFVATIDTRGITRVRVACMNNTGTTNIAINWRCAAITCDAIG